MDTMRAFMTYAWRNGSIPAVPPFPLKSEYGLGEKNIPTIPRDVQFEIIRLIPEIHRPIFYWLALHPGRRPGKDAPHLKLIHGGKEESIHKNYTRQEKDIKY